MDCTPISLWEKDSINCISLVFFNESFFLDIFFFYFIFLEKFDLGFLFSWLILFLDCTHKKSFNLKKCFNLFSFYSFQFFFFWNGIGMSFCWNFRSEIKETEEGRRWWHDIHLIRSTLTELNQSVLILIIWGRLIKSTLIYKISMKISYFGNKDL